VKQSVCFSLLLYIYMLHPNENHIQEEALLQTQPHLISLTKSNTKISRNEISEHTLLCIVPCYKVTKWQTVCAGKETEKMDRKRVGCKWADVQKMQCALHILKRAKREYLHAKGCKDAKG
jgi:hypothetical protein